MNSAQSLIAFSLAGLVFGRVVQAVLTKTSVWEVLFNLGVPAVLAAAAGGFSVLKSKAGTLQDVSAIHQGAVISAGNRLGVSELTELGNRLVIDYLAVYLVFIVTVALVLFELRVGTIERGKPPRRVSQWPRYVGLGFIVPTFFGVFAMALVYVGS
jgi:hypothetical protein